MKKIILLIMMINLITSTTADTIKVYPTEDSYIDSSRKNIALGDTYPNSIRVGYAESWGNFQSYFKFNLPILENIKTAKFIISTLGNVENPLGEIHFLSDDSWQENSITWNNAPNHESQITDSQIINSQAITEFNITPIINEQDKVLSFVLIDSQQSTTDNYANFYSKDTIINESYWPYLSITYNESNSQECNSPADTDCNSCVSLIEIVNLMLQYKNGQANISLLEMVNLMLQYKQGGISC